MSNGRSQFDLTVQRYVDAEMPDAERQRFEAELTVDESLQAAVEELRALRSCFAPERVAGALQPDPGFTTRVVTEIERSALPQMSHMLAIEAWSRRAIVAAVFVCGLALLVVAGLLRGTDTGRLEASPAEIERVMEQLDAEIRSAGAENGR